jgi:hypothetical protein
MFKVGMWPFYGGKLAGRRFVSIRNFVPLVFVLSLLISLTASWWTPFGWFLFGGIAATYGTISLISALPLVKRERDMRYLLMAPLMFAITHVIYGIGSAYGILKPVSRKTS